MKKILILILLIILNVSIYIYKSKTVFIEKIDFNLENKEYIVSFIDDKILLESFDLNILIPLSIDSNTNDLKRLNIDKYDYLINIYGYDYDIDSKKVINLEDDFKINDISIKYDQNIIIDINNQHICFLFENTSTNCEHVFLLNKEVEITDNIKTIFYKESDKDYISSKIYKKWIDNYILNDEAFTFLKIDQEYDVFIVPKNNE